jgi:drug/metabolite transporter (DMT)-like permease
MDDRAQAHPAAKAGVFTVFLPLTSAIVGIVFLGERFTTVHLIAFWLRHRRRTAGDLAVARRCIYG